MSINNTKNGRRGSVHLTETPLPHCPGKQGFQSPLNYMREFMSLFQRQC